MENVDDMMMTCHYKSTYLPRFTVEERFLIEQTHASSSYVAVVSSAVTRRDDDGGAGGGCGRRHDDDFRFRRASFHSSALVLLHESRDSHAASECVSLCAKDGHRDERDAPRGDSRDGGLTESIALLVAIDVLQRHDGNPRHVG